MVRRLDEASRALHGLAAGVGLALLLLGAGCTRDPAAMAGREPVVATKSLASQSTTEPALAKEPLTARGNEPGWSLTIGAVEIELVADYGATRSTYPRPAAKSTGNATRYVVADADLTITLVEQPCADNMSGMFYPLTVTVEQPEGVLSGCGGEPASLLLGPEWEVESIGGGRLIGGSSVTLAFDEGGRVSGVASCNRYLASYELTGEGLSIAGGASTMMACEPLLMSRNAASWTRWKPSGASRLLPMALSCSWPTPDRS